MCRTSLYFRANSKHLNPPPQTHLPPQSTTSHINNTHTHTQTRHTAPKTWSWPHLLGSAWVFCSPSFIHPHDVSKGSSFVLWTRCRKVFVREVEEAVTRGTGVRERIMQMQSLMSCALKLIEIKCRFYFSCHAHKVTEPPERTWMKISY